jgi:hypothetical protein
MVTLVSIPLVLWLATIIACPRRPRLGNEVEELVYSRLLGRHHLLIGFAMIVTAATLLAAVLTLPRQIDPTLGKSRELDQYCASVAAGAPFCYRMESDGRWAQAVRLSDGQWAMSGRVPMPPTGSAPEPDRSVAQPQGR